MKTIIDKLSKIKASSLQLKVVFSFAFIIVVIAGLAFFNVQRVQQIEEQFGIQNTKVDKKIMAMELKEKAQELDLMSSELAISEDRSLEQRYEAKRTEFLALVKKVGDNASDREQRKWRAQMTTASTEFADNFYHIAVILQDSSLTDEERAAKLKQRIKMSQAHKTYIFQMTDNFTRVFSLEADTAINTSKDLLDQTIRVMLIAILIVIAISIVVTVLFLRSFVKPIRMLQNAVRRVAEGDLRVRIKLDSSDEIGQLSRSFDEMTEQMAGMLTASRQIAASMKELSAAFENEAYVTAAAGGEILKAMNEISTGADRQATQAEFSVNGIHELDQHIGEIGQITHEMQQMSEETKVHTRHGSVSVESLHDAARNTEDQLAHMVLSLEELSKSSNQIGKISTAIEEISRQTNLLAVNATIEAAHAGSHGRGFAVIADQVRELSEQAKDSSRHIYELIHSLQNQMAKVQADMRETGDSLKAQNTAIERTADAFGIIERSTRSLALQMDSIHGKVAEAVLKNKLLIDSIRIVSDVADETASGVEEINSSTMEQDHAIRLIAEQARTVNQLAEQMFAEISKFKIMV